MADFMKLAELVRPSSPNTYLIGPQDYFVSARPDETITLQQPASKVFETIDNFVGAQRGWDVVGRDNAGLRLSFVTTSPLMKFKDDVDVIVLDRPDGATPVIYSRSRVGYSDLGANRKRVRGILAALE